MDSLPICLATLGWVGFLGGFFLSPIIITLMLDWYLGTMGFGYKDWKGVFYPPAAQARDYLAFYSRYFNSVELDTTFYGTPRAHSVRSWASATPDDFRFCAKTPQVITHERGLVGTTDLMIDFLVGLQPLGARLGVVLLQFPPSFTSIQLDILSSFLQNTRAHALGRDVCLAVEFRHGSWYTDRSSLISLLSHHEVCWASTEYPDLPAEVNCTTSFHYIRWIGQHGRYASHERERVDMTQRLARWWGQLMEVAGELDSIYGFFNNDFAGHAPATCNRFKALAGLSVQSPDHPRQGRLF